MKKLILLFLLFVFSSPLFPCSRIMWVGADGHVIVGRNLDFFEEMKFGGWVFPAGIERDGLVKGNSMKWTSKYGSFVTSVYDMGTCDGINEKGLIATDLYLEESDYGVRDESRPGISITLWLQFFVDNFATVDEAVKYIQSNDMQPISVLLAGIPGTFHIVLGDITGDNAVIEYVNGKPVIYHSKDYKIVTNTPSYDKQLANLKNYQSFGGDKPLPGTCLSMDRFVRASFFTEHLPASPKTEDAAIAGVLSVIRNIAQPIGTIYYGKDGSPSQNMTVLSAVIDVTNGLYFFANQSSPYICWINLKKLNFSKDAPIMKLSLQNYEYLGDVTDKLVASEPFKFK
jgi:penicillin V acylase-like amidase (Ntn superfamily)